MIVRRLFRGSRGSGRLVPVGGRSACILLVFLFLPLGAVGQGTLSWREILAAPGRIELRLERIWGDERSDDPHQAFANPVAVQTDTAGNVYILDSHLAVVRQFTGNGGFIREFGGKGQGPGQFILPTLLAVDQRGGVWVVDNLRRAIGGFTENGTFRRMIPQTGLVKEIAAAAGRIGIIQSGDGFSGDRLTLFREGFTQPKSLLRVVYRGMGAGNWESCVMALGADGSPLVSMVGTPLVMRLDGNGRCLWKTGYTPPFPVFHRLIPSPDQGGLAVEVDKTEILLYGMAVDGAGNLFLVVKTRKMNEEEKKLYSRQVVVVRGQYLINHRVRSSVDGDHTDLFRLLVLDRDGRCLASCPLTVFCDKIHIHGDSLFVVDANAGKRICQYRFRIRK